MKMQQPDLELGDGADMAIFSMRCGSSIMDFRIKKGDPDEFAILKDDKWIQVGTVKDGETTWLPNILEVADELLELMTSSGKYLDVRQAWRNAETGKWNFKAKPASSPAS